MSFTHWFRSWQNARPTGRRSPSTYLNVEFLEARTLLASPVSLTPILSNPVINPVSGLTSSLLNPVTNLLNPVTNLLNPVISSVSPLLGSIINPLLGSPLPGSLVSPLVGPAIGSLPSLLQTTPLGPVTSLPSAIALPSLPSLNPGNLFQPKPTQAGSYVPASISGLGGTQYNASQRPVAYYSAPTQQPFSSGGLGDVVTATTSPMDSSSGAGPSGGNDAIVTVGLGEDDESTVSSAGLREVMLAFDDDLSIPDLAATLLTGVRPRASLLPQRGSQVAPVATLLSDDASDMISGTAFDEDGRLQDLLINPAASYPRDSSSLTPPSEDERVSEPARNSSIMLPQKDAPKSSIPGLLVSGLLTAMMTLQLFRTRRADSKKSEKPSLAA